MNKTKRNIKYRQNSANPFQTIYIEKYKIYALISEKEAESLTYNENEEEENNDEKNRNPKSKLESLIENIEEQIEQKIEESNNQEENQYSINSLESLIKPANKNEKYITKHKYQENLHSYKYASRLNSHSTSSHINAETGAQVFYVPSSYLPKNVLGMYLPALHVIYIASDLSPKVKEFVYYHEIAHAKGISDEMLADEHATQRTRYRLVA